MDPQIVTKEIFIECTPETLFPFLTDPHKMVRWMGSQVLLEPKVGGAFRINFNGVDMVAGHYLEVKPHERVVFTWGWTGSDTFPPGSSTVEVQLHQQDKGTLLSLKHTNLPISRSRKHSEGWNYYITRLQALLRGEEPGPDTFAIPAGRSKEENS